MIKKNNSSAADSKYFVKRDLSNETQVIVLGGF